VVPPKLTHVLNKNPCCDATGRKSQRHFFQVRRTAYSVRLYPCSITGAPELGYLRFTRSPVQLGGPFGFCAFALLSEFLLGSLEIALKRTRPRQRFCIVLSGIV